MYRNTLRWTTTKITFAETEDGIELDRFIDKGYILNWETPIDWEDEDTDLLYDEYFLQGSDQYYNRRQYDTRS